MYTDFFQLREEPFQVTPNPKYLFLSSVHRMAVQKLADGVRRRKGFLEMVGEAGTGKTLLCKELIQMLSPEMDIAYLFFPVLNEQTLYHTILKQWGQEVPEETDVSRLIEEIHIFLKGRFERGRNALIILDEAQNLSISLLENLRLLSNLETESEKLLQILLTGQPEFHALLKGGRIPQLDQRIRVRVFLDPLDRETLPLYIYHRLNTAGGRGNLEFTDDAFDRIYALSGGIPRLINAICERALEEAYLRKSYHIDAALIQESQKERGEISPPRKLARRKTFTRFAWFYRVGLGLAMILFLGFILWLVMAAPFRFRTTGKPESSPVQKKSAKFERPIPTRLTLRPCPLNRMRSLVESLLPLSPGIHLYWGDVRLRQKDLIWLHTPVLLHMANDNGVVGWICARDFIGSHCQIWMNGEWRSVGYASLSAWTGRCELPFWFTKGDWDGHALHPGSRGPAVLTLQTWLAAPGELKESTGFFDKATQVAVKRFQMQEGLKPDGVAGRQTLALLFQKAGASLRHGTSKGEHHETN